MIAYGIGLAFGGLIAAVTSPTMAVIIGVVTALVYIAFVFGQAVHDVRNSG